jgi:beta-carotene ketolase (CrtW type)
MAKVRSNKGIWYAVIIHVLWWSCLIYALSIPFDWSSPIVYVLILVQTHLYTGLFITAHDAMHGTVSANKQLNKAIGTVSALLFSYNFYGKLNPKHHEHHKYVATDKDPDYHRGNSRFWPWYFSFVKQYVSIWQILLMAISFNVLKIWLPQENLIFLWMLPAILSTFQLFYFGTYLPHRGEHDQTNTQRSRSQKLNHAWAFLTCYFFGYHYEHHASPGTPWWQLYKVKEKQELKGYPGQ